MKDKNLWTWFVYLLGILLFIGGVALIVFGHYVEQGCSGIDLKKLFLNSYGNVGSGLIEAAITILIIDTLYQMRERRSNFILLLRQARSRDNLTALQALEELRQNKWLKKKTLRGRNLIRANLENVQLLADLDLTKTQFSNATLINANFNNTILNNAILSEAILKEADFISSKLSGAILIKANLENAVLQGVALEGAVLSGANLTYATIEGCTFDRETIMPDGEAWTSQTDISRFTNPMHPNYWNPDNMRKT